MTAIALSLLIALAPAADAVPANPERGCGATSYRVPPTHMYVFRIHRKGSSVPARVERWRFRDYVGAVAESGAWPARKPPQSLRVGVIAIKQYAWWMALHSCRSFRGRAYAITDSEQFLARTMRPGYRAHSKVRAAMDATWDVSLRKRGRFFRTGWSGGGRGCGTAIDHWHLSENAVTACALKGWSWRRIVSVYLRPVTIVDASR